MLLKREAKKCEDLQHGLGQLKRQKVSLFASRSYLPSTTFAQMHKTMCHVPTLTFYFQKRVCVICVLAYVV